MGSKQIPPNKSNFQPVISILGETAPKVQIAHFHEEYLIIKTNAGMGFLFSLLVRVFANNLQFSKTKKPVNLNFVQYFPHPP